MSHSIFGWSYPPGCSGPPDEDEGPCEVCGLEIDNCICPECPECESYGDPHCYIHHSLRRTEEQKFHREITDRDIRDLIISERMNDDAMYEEWLKDQMVGLQ